jgi:hypothetical protein
MGSIPVSTIKYPNSIIFFGRKTFEELNEPAFILNLYRVSVAIGDAEGSITLSSGREDILVYRFSLTGIPKDVDYFRLRNTVSDL